MRVADYIAKTLADRGICQVFMITGGAAMFLNNAFGSEPRLNITCNHHEQASAMAAEGYFRACGKMAAVNVTAGPGSINALNGVFGAWTDSIPMLVISGQVKRQTCMGSYDIPGLRQLGDQEVDIVRMVRGITKYAVMLTDPATVPYHLDRAMYLATTGRPGSCWIDIPIDIQSAELPANCPAYDPAEDAIKTGGTQLTEVLRRLVAAKRPVIIAGTGIRLAGAVDPFNDVIRKLAIPVTTAWTHDLIASDDPLYCGRQGTIGQRAGNFSVQNADLILILGARLPIRQISYNWDSFAPKAYKIWVDIDVAELNKPTVKPDLPIHCDVKTFLEELNAAPYESGRHTDWLAWCRKRLALYPPVTARQRQFNGAINPYHFIETLFENLADDDVVVCGDATACIVPFQTAKLKLGQRLFSNSGSASMGWDLPAAIGAAIARNGKRVICLAGDGSIQMNLQELQTIIHHRLPIKIFVLSNGGYLSIRTTQTNFFGKQTGSGPSSGVSTPDMLKIAAAYGIPAIKIDQKDFAPLIRQSLATDGPFLADVTLDQSQAFEPRLSSRQLPDGRLETAPLEDMYPFLDRDELKNNML